MTRMPTDLSGRERVRVLEKIGFVVKRQRGSHIILRRDNPYARVVVPDHRALRIGTLRTILNSAGMTAEQLVELLCYL